MSLFVVFHPDSSCAAVTDATASFADNWWTTPSSKQPSLTESGSIPDTAASDELTVTLSKQELMNGLGLELVDIEFRTNLRVYVKSVVAGSYAKRLGIQKDWVVVAVNGQSMERTNAAGVKQYLSQAISNNNNSVVTLTFRDPSVFRSKLQDLSSSQGRSVTTQVAPAGDTTQRNPDGSVMAGKTVTTAVADQRVTVQQMVAPVRCTRGAETDDLLEVSYTGTVVETGQIFDGSSVLIDGKGIPGRGNDVTIFFVLGKQPFGQFPPGWDVGLYGMCVGERRRLILPPALGYGSTGVPRRNIPPNATLQYDITLVSINGLAMPQ
jgi:FKBP-type peptidyl-prolyl cis-trans isomerase